MKWNKPLVIGTLILSILLLVVVIPHVITDKNPYSIRTLKYTAERVDGVIEFEQAPFAPSEKYVWGSDGLGRDVFSFVIYGTRLTLKIALLVTLFRFALALPLGILSGFNFSVPKNIIRQVNILFSGLPPLLFAIIVLYLNIFTRLDKTWSTLAFITVLTLVGFGKLALAFEEATKTVIDKPYITSEYLLGKSKYEVAIENVVPHIMPEVVVLFFMEIARVLTLQIQLGLFAIFIGNLRILLSDNGGVVRYWQVSFEPEWASLLGYASTALRVAPWMVLFPTAAFSVSVLGFNMFGEGIRIKLQDSKSNFIPKVRQIVSVIFIKKHRHEQINYKKPIIVVVIFMLVVTMINMDFTPVNLGQKEYIAKSELPDRLYVGMDEVGDVTKLLADKMAEIGLETVYDNYTQTYEVEQNYYIDKSELIINGTSYQQGRDYIVRNFSDSDISSVEIIDVRSQSLYNESYYDSYKGKCLWVDGSFYTDKALEEFSKTLVSTGCKAMIISNHDWQTSMGSFVGEMPLIGIDNIELSNGDSLDFTSHTTLLSNQGINVVGKISGQDQNAEQEVIVLGLPLNYRDVEEGYLTYNYALEMIENFKKDSNRTLVLAFFDGTYDLKTHGIMDYSSGMKFDPYMHTEYFNIRTIDYNEGVVEINRDMSPMTQYFGISFFQSLNSTDLEYSIVKEQLPENFIDLIKHPDFIMHHKKGIDSIMIDVYSDADSFYEAFYKALKENN